MSVDYAAIMRAVRPGHSLRLVFDEDEQGNVTPMFVAGRTARVVDPCSMVRFGPPARNQDAYAFADSDGSVVWGFSVAESVTYEHTVAVAAVNDIRHATRNLGPGGECPCVLMERRRHERLASALGRDLPYWKLAILKAVAARAAKPKPNCPICAGSGTITDPAPMVACPDCGGDGRARIRTIVDERTMGWSCGRCHGSGRAVRRERCGCTYASADGAPFHEVHFRADPAGGTMLARRDCTACRGTGEVEVPEDYQFDDERQDGSTRDHHVEWYWHYQEFTENAVGRKFDQPRTVRTESRDLVNGAGLFTNAGTGWRGIT